MTFLLILLLFVGIVVGVYSRSRGSSETAALFVSFIFVLAVYGLACLIGDLI